MRSFTRPLPMRPRLDPKPWGGRGLAAFGFALPPDEPIGEALITAGDAIVTGEAGEERPLGDLVAAAPEAIAGPLGLAATGQRPLFPLLIKLIEATSHLSIQVHPDDAAARREGPDRLGKTEAWHILAAQPGATLFAGLQEGSASDHFAAEVRRGTRVVHHLRRLPARAGTTILLPAGTIHALGAGTLVYEVQQPSEITYRLDDWGRVDAAGNPRPLHLEPGLAVSNAALRPEVIAPIDLPIAAGRRQILTACRYFAVERLALPAGAREVTRCAGSAQVITCLRGAARVASGDGEAPLAAGGSLVVPAAAGAATIATSAPAILLRAWVPDLAGEIVAPAQAAGAGATAIAALAGETGDLAPYLAPR